MCSSDLVELALPNGAYELVARYAGDGDFAPSASASLAQVVRAATTTGVVSSADPAAYGQSVTLTVTISTVDGSVATGTVSISEGSTTVGACALASGSCTVTTAALGVGVHLLDVRYGGDAGHAPDATTYTQTVVQAPTVTTLASSAPVSAVYEIGRAHV